MYQRTTTLAVLAAVGLIVAPRTARADNLDVRLLREATAVMQVLQDRQYKNIGVLKFRVQKGEREPSFDVGLLNANMATRLEYALILANNESNPIGITRDASRTAASLDKKASYLMADQRKGLFELRYPLAWGKDRVSVDAFLTGVVQLDRDFRKTTVAIESFDRKDAELQQIVKFTVDTDRSILSDAGETFSLVKRNMGLSQRGDELDEAAVKNAAERSDGKASKNTDPVEQVLDLGIYYDGNKQEIKTEADGNRRVAGPPDGKPVWFTVKNKTKDRLAIVLRVNGVNTLHKEGPEKQVDQCTKWVLDPDTLYSIKGFYLRDNRVEEFKVQSPAGLTSLDPQKLGLIEVAVFQKGEDKDPLTSKRISLRGLTAEQSPDTFKELKELVFKAAQPRPAFKGLIMPGETKPGQEIKEVKVEDLNYAGSMTIRYFP
jgi:hypothetical protein